MFLNSFASMNGHTYSTANGYETGFIESGPKFVKVAGDGCFHINAAHKQGAYVQQNGYDGIAVISPPGKISGKEGLGLKNIDFDGSLCSIAPDGQNTVNKNVKGYRYEDVKRVLKKRDVHDLTCPTCNLYFTKRVILPRKAISPDPTGEVSVPMPEVTRTSLTEPEPEFSKVDVIKAIVYGGLLESIASLSIIVSAAGGDATTLNIVALGLANVFGGLLVLANNLMTLKELSSQQYEDQLGQPRHYLIHALIAVISYLVIGLVTPLIYGFSFYNSDNKYFKLATVSGASLAFVTVLSIGKAYVQRPPKAYFQTMLYYISLAVTGSGIAYVVGALISILLKKLSVFELSNSVSMPGLEARTVSGPWSSY